VISSGSTRKPSRKRLVIPLCRFRVVSDDDVAPAPTTAAASSFAEATRYAGDEPDLLFSGHCLNLSRLIVGE